MRGGPVLICSGRAWQFLQAIDVNVVEPAKIERALDTVELGGASVQLRSTYLKVAVMC